jgi:hypothetical protein
VTLHYASRFCVTPACACESNFTPAISQRSLGIALFLPPASSLIFFIVFVALLTFLLVGADKLTGGQFVDFLNGLVGRLQR